MSHALITGGAGFIGTNVAARLASLGHEVVILDDLSRPGVEANVRRSCAAHGGRVRCEVGDVNDPDVVGRLVAGADRVVHLAAQVAVTTSVTDPVHDFDVNLHGTLVLLEALRRRRDPPPLLMTSTNKVYGALDDLPLQRRGDRWEPVDRRVRAHGVGEDRPLQFCSPYGCSKGGADQYVLDYARTYGMPTVVFRMSCIYGPHQCGSEDQGWVAHFLRRALAGEPVNLYGDGCQVRDVLFVDDLVDAMQLAIGRAHDLAGRAFNIGGGPANTVSLLELLDLIGMLTGRRPATGFGPERIGDQRYYVSDTRRFRAATGWSPTVGVERGVAQLLGWLRDDRVAVAEVG